VTCSEMYNDTSGASRGLSATAELLVWLVRLQTSSGRPVSLGNLKVNGVFVFADYKSATQCKTGDIVMSNLTSCSLEVAGDCE